MRHESEDETVSYKGIFCSSVDEDLGKRSPMSGTAKCPAVKSFIPYNMLKYSSQLSKSSDAIEMQRTPGRDKVSRKRVPMSGAAKMSCNNVL